MTHEKVKMSAVNVKSLLRNNEIFVRSFEEKTPLCHRYNSVNVYSVNSAVIIVETLSDFTTKGEIYRNVEVIIDSKKPFKDLEGELLLVTCLKKVE